MDQIFEIVYHGQGGFTFDQVYNMPVNVRSYYYAKLANTIKEKNQAIEDANKKANQK